MRVQEACTPARGSSSGEPSFAARSVAAIERQSGRTSVQSSNYWSATTNATTNSNAWDVNFNNGDVNNDDKSNNNFTTRLELRSPLLRGAQV